MSRKTSRRAKSAARRKRKQLVSPPASAPSAPLAPIPPVATTGTAEDDAPRRRNRAAIWAVAGFAALVLAVGVLAALVAPADVGQVAATPSPTIFVGEPGGAVIPEAESPTPSPTSTASPSSTPESTPAPTPEPVVTVPPPPTPTPAPPAPPSLTPAPTAVIVAVAQPEDSVAAFYGNVADGNFDAAYALWSDRMKATYPRQANLDDRFDETASITFHQLRLVDRTDGTATVQANFTETYDSGGSREFIGYWELVQVNGRWLLDAPHY